MSADGEIAKPVAEDRLASEFLANERTFLAWIRTSVAILSLGFVIAKFRIWMHELGPNSSANLPHAKFAESSIVGVAMIVLGGLLAVLAAWRYHVVNLQIEKGKVSADRGLIIFVTLLVGALVVVMVGTVW
jgi:putative membrane protein